MYTRTCTYLIIQQIQESRPTRFAAHGGSPPRAFGALNASMAAACERPAVKSNPDMGGAEGFSHLMLDAEVKEELKDAAGGVAHANPNADATMTRNGESGGGEAEGTHSDDAHSDNSISTRPWTACADIFVSTPQPSTPQPFLWVMCVCGGVWVRAHAYDRVCCLCLCARRHL